MGFFFECERGVVIGVVDPSMRGMWMWDVDEEGLRMQTHNTLRIPLLIS